jgi:hypothetical protein
MGKRSDGFERKGRDYYPTIDPKAAARLAAHIEAPQTYCEPCAGAGDLIDGLDTHKWVCLSAFDTEPQSEVVVQRDALDLCYDDVKCCDLIVTNPPFARGILLPILDHFLTLKPTWLLLPGDIIHNKYMAPYLGYCSDILAIGRMYWEENKVSGKDNYVWVRFSKDHIGGTYFHGRTP